MKKEYITDYKSFISEWRERYIEVPKDIRKGKIWKPIDVAIPEPWSENAIYSIKTAKYKFFMVVDYGDEKYRYQLNNELISLQCKHEHVILKDDD